jgi:DNA-binding NtrC family response regulator
MSAKLSSTASEPIGPRRKQIELSPCLRDSDSDVDKHYPSVHRAGDGSTVPSIVDFSRSFNIDSPNPPHPPHVLVIDESRHVRQMCCEVAEAFGFVGIEAETVPAARKILERKDSAILIVDLAEHERASRFLLAELRSICPDALVIGMSSSATIASAVEIMRAGAFDYLSKPFPLDQLTRTFDRAHKRLCFDLERRKLRAIMSGSSGMIQTLGQSVGMENLYQILSKVSDSKHPVMIVGETGTGKEQVARSIHSNSRDSSRPFVSVDCRSLSSISLEQMLFGEPMSATGEMGSHRRGLLAAPEGGTVFLDEISSLTRDLQKRLAKAIREKVVPRPGDERVDNLSVRVLAATSYDLTQMLKDGSFRMDLYSCLSLMNLKIPPLRHRPEDIAFLAQRFLEKIGRVTGVARTLPQETLRMLEIYDWPENTRELETAITQACTLSPGPKVEVDHLPANVLMFARAADEKRKKPTSAFLGKLSGNSGEESVVPMATMEKQAILTALKQTDNDKIKAAKLLGIGKTTLYRKLKEYDLGSEQAPAALPSSSSEAVITSNASDLPSNLVCA